MFRMTREKDELQNTAISHMSDHNIRKKSLATGSIMQLRFDMNFLCSMITPQFPVLCRFLIILLEGRTVYQLEEQTF